MIKTGIFGGSFNPIHNGHISLAKQIKKIAKLDEIWFVVSPHNPLKDSAELMSDNDRLQMVRLAVEDEPGLVASDCEFKLPRPSYMLHTLQNLSKDFPDREFTLIIGADNWLCFDKWFGYNEILERYKIIVYPREGSKLKAEELPQGVKLVDTELYNVSSTQIRKMMKEGKSIDKLVPAKVSAYIKSVSPEPPKAMNEGYTPEISVIIPVYNKEKYVEDCIRSIATQDFYSYETIIVDDGSTDSSAEICDRLAREFSNITVVHTENGGVTAARRIGVEHSKGKFVTFADADDKMLPKALRTLYEEITSSNADEVVARYINQYGTLCGHNGGQFMNHSWMIKELLASKADFCVLWAVIFKKTMLEDCLNTPRLIRSGEDILMQIEFLMKKPKVWFSDEVVYMYNAGLPNDRPLDLKEQMLYDDILKEVFKKEMKEFEPYIVLHQAKMYENFIYNRQFDVFNKYYKQLRSANKSKLSLADRIAIMLPPRLAYFPIAMKKDKF